MPFALTNVCHRGKGGHAVACRDFRFWHKADNGGFLTAVVCPLMTKADKRSAEDLMAFFVLLPI
jgi:hypothetical protein